LTKSAARYLETRDTRRELTYEAMLASGRTDWTVGDRVRVYRTAAGTGGVVEEPDGESRRSDPRDYDVEHYGRVLRDTFASRLARALTESDYAAVIADPSQPSLFAPALDEARTVLNRHTSAGGLA
jgi:hypothetical protein